MDMDAAEFRRQARQSAKQRLENRFQDAFLRIKPEGVPLPVREWRFHDTRRWRFDFAFPQEAVKLAIEIHGGGFTNGGHNRGAHQVNDFEKFNEAQRLGWIVLQFGTKQLDDPEACAAYVVDVIAALGQRQHAGVSA